MKLIKFKIITSLLFVSILPAANATQEAINNSIQIVQDARDGISSSNELTTHLVLLTQNTETLSQTIELTLGPDGKFPFIPKRSQSTVNRPSLNNHIDSGLFRIHYDLTGEHGIDNTDSDGSGLPDYLEYVMKAGIEIELKLINEMGYNPPPSDAIFQENDFGGSSHYDIYLLSIGSSFYGYTQPENFVGDNPNSTLKEINAYTSYLVLRNNYDNFNENTIEENIQVTLAHEYLHSIQFGYDIEDEIWFMEATSTWMEDQAYTNVNDCYQYIEGWFKYPHYSIHQDMDSHSWYGSFIFFQYIGENLGGSHIIREFWERSVTFGSNETHSTYSLIDAVLAEKNSSVSEAMRGMAVANWILDPAPLIGPYSYAEGEFYPVTPSVYSIVDFTGTEEIIIKDSTLSAFGSRYIKINSDLPVRVFLSSNNTEIDDLVLYGIQKDSDGLYWIGNTKSGSSLNIHHTENSEYLVLAIVNTADPDLDAEYSVTIETGDSEQPFLLTSVTPEPFITSRNDSCSFNLIVYEEQELEISVIDQFNDKIRTIEKDNYPKGVYSLGWDGKLSNGNFAKSGTYFIKAENPADRSYSFREVILVSSPSLSVSNPYPNPGYGNFRFTAIIGSTQFVKVKVVDLSGRTIAVLAQRYYSPGEVKFRWNGKMDNGQNAPSGIYLIGLEGESETVFQKATLLR